MRTKNKIDLVTVLTSIGEGENEQDVYASGIVSYYIDNDYGADADGNRGQTMVFVDDILDITVRDVEGNLIPEAQLSERDKNRINRDLEEKFFNN